MKSYGYFFTIWKKEKLQQTNFELLLQMLRLRTSRKI